jgi:hypothetical protein
MNYIHVILHITTQKKAEQDRSVIVTLGALQTHKEVPNFITHLLINRTIWRHLHLQLFFTQIQNVTYHSYSYVRKTNKMHTFLNNLLQLNYPRHVLEHVIVHHQEQFCTSSLQYFTMHLKRSLVADTIWMYKCKLLVHTSWWWTITRSKHVEDNLSEIYY